MGWVIVLVGGLLAAISFLRGLGLDPISAPQQAVQDLRLVQGYVAVIVIAIGVAIEVLRIRTPRTPVEQVYHKGHEPQAVPAPVGKRVGDDNPIVVGQEVSNVTWGRGTVQRIEGKTAYVDFGKGIPVPIVFDYLYTVDASA